MKKLILAAVIFGCSQTVFADPYHDLALDAASKFSQIGSHSCKNKTRELTITKATSGENGAHIEAQYEVKSPTSTYQIEIVDGVVTKVVLTSTLGS